VELAPEDLPTCQEWAIACIEAGDADGMARAADRLRRLAPRDRISLNMWGLACMNRFEFDQAAEAFCTAVEVEPQAIGALVNIEVLSMRSLRHRRFFEKTPMIAAARAGAIQRLKESYSRAELDDGELKDLLMLLAGGQETFAEALELAHDLARREKFSLVLANQLTMIFQLAGDLRNTQRFDSIVFGLDPSSAFVRFGHAQVCLFGGYDGWARSWEAFRDYVPHSSPAVFAREVPTWTGQALGGGKILVYQEQGIGDAILALRAVAHLPKRGIRFDLWVNPALAGLARSVGGFERLIETAARPDARKLGCEFAISLLGLISTLQLRPEDLAGHPTVLVPSADRALSVRERLRALPGLRIGLAYAGSPMRRDDWFRAVPLQALAALTRLRGVSWVNLTFDPRPDREEVVRLLEALDPMDQVLDYEDTAAIISELDAVVAIDSSVAHLAASLGKRQWVLVPPMLDWRWQIGEDTKPWWPTVTLLRAREPGQWDDVIAELARQLEVWRG